MMFDGPNETIMTVGYTLSIQMPMSLIVILWNDSFQLC